MMHMMLCRSHGGIAADIPDKVQVRYLEMDRIPCQPCLRQYNPCCTSPESFLEAADDYSGNGYRPLDGFLKPGMGAPQSGPSNRPWVIAGDARSIHSIVQGTGRFLVQSLRGILFRTRNKTFCYDKDMQSSVTASGGEYFAEAALSRPQ